MYATRERFFPAIDRAGAPRRDEKNDELRGPSRDSDRQLRKFQFIPVSVGSVRPFKCHANAATNATTESR